LNAILRLWDQPNAWERTVPLLLPIEETFDIGSKTGTPVDGHDYQIPFTFTGKIDKLTIALNAPKLTPEDVRSWKQPIAPRKTRTKPATTAEGRPRLLHHRRPVVCLHAPRGHKGLSLCGLRRRRS
jgi:hypothetical protein